MHTYHGLMTILTNFKFWFNEYIFQRLLDAFFSVQFAEVGTYALYPKELAYGVLWHRWNGLVYDVGDVCRLVVGVNGVLNPLVVFGDIPRGNQGVLIRLYLACEGLS